LLVTSASANSFPRDGLRKFLAVLLPVRHEQARGILVAALGVLSSSRNS
jgi:hypothetical protein